MTDDILLILAAFAAAAVEMVEAATIVLAVGITYSWRTSILGVVAALGLLAIVTAALGPSLVRLIPLNVLQLVIGSLLLAFGLQWLRKAVQRAAHARAQRNEDAIFKMEVEELQTVRERSGGISQTAGFLISFKGVFLEGLEVAFIVVTFGAASGSTALAATGALAAVVTVALAAAVAHRPLSRVPENTIKLGVGLLLVSFGTFWAGEGLGIEWSGGDVTIVILLGAYSALAFGVVAALGNGWLRSATGPSPAHGQEARRPWWSPVGFGRFWYDFLVGDSATLALGTAVCLMAGWVLVSVGQSSGGQIAMPVMTAVTLGLSVFWH